MGYIVHHAILVIGREGENIEAPHSKALEIFAGIAGVSPLVPATINGYESFFVAPDGSKSGWNEGLAADAARAEFVAWLESPATRVEWAEVQFGDEGGDQKIVAASGMDREG